jgi:hypothetical protein
MLEMTKYKKGDFMNKLNLIIYACVFFTVFSSNVFSLTHDEAMERTIGGEIAVPEWMSNLDLHAQHSDLGAVSRSILGHLYTGITSVEYLDDNRATVHAYVGNTKCIMNMIKTEFEATLTGGFKTGWKVE